MGSSCKSEIGSNSIPALTTLDLDQHTHCEKRLAKRVEDQMQAQRTHTHTYTHTYTHEHAQT